MFAAVLDDVQHNSQATPGSTRSKHRPNQFPHPESWHDGRAQRTEWIHRCRLPQIRKASDRSKSASPAPLPYQTASKDKLPNRQIPGNVPFSAATVSHRRDFLHQQKKIQHSTSRTQSETAPERCAGNAELPQINIRINTKRIRQAHMRPGVFFTTEPPDAPVESSIPAESE